MIFKIEKMKTFDINKIQLTIQSPGIVIDEKLQNYLISKIDKLGRTYLRIKKCELVLRLEKNSQNKNFITEGKLFVPRNILFAKQRDVNFKIASRKMFDDLFDQLLKHKEKRQKNNFEN